VVVVIVCFTGLVCLSVEKPKLLRIFPGACHCVIFSAQSQRLRLRFGFTAQCIAMWTGTCHIDSAPISTFFLKLNL